MLRVVAIAIGLLKMLLELQQTRKAGALDVAGPSARVRLFVEDGRVVFADEGTVGETLGRILVREHVLTQEQYGAAIEWMSDLRSAGKTAKLGEVFVDLGLLTHDQVIAALSAQVQQKVMRALAWSSATFRFLESHGPLDLADRFVTAIEPLVIAALRLADQERIFVLLSQARPRYPALRGDRLPGGGSTRLETIARVNAFRLPAAEDAFARTLDGSRTVAELLDEGDDPDAARVDRGVVLAALLLTDALDLHRGPTAVRPMGRPKPARGLAASASAKLSANARAKASADADAEAKVDADADADADAEAKVEAGPSSHANPHPSALEWPLPPAISMTVSMAGESVPESEPRMPGGAKMAPLLAEKAFQAGKKLVRAHRLAEAVAELKRAASLYKAVEYDLWAAWAEARADARGEAQHVEALRTVAELAIEQDTERGFATFVLGHLAKRRGDDARAAALFARARALDPEIATIDEWEVRLKIGEPSPASTRGEVSALAPLLTGEKGETGAKPGASAEAKADDADARSEPREEEGASESGAALQVAADARLGTELRTRADREMAVRARRRKPRAPARVVHAVDAIEAARPKSSRGWLVPAAIVAAITAGIWVVARSGPHDAAPVVTAATTATTTATTMTTASTPATSATSPLAVSSSPAEPASAAPAASVATAASVAPAVSVAPDSSGVPSGASYAEVDAGLPSVDSSKGVLVLPSAADGHRVYVDGRVVGVPPPPIVVGCGRHIVKLGSQGREQIVSVPCGGSLPLAYP
jgi:tetratricopeptide (TPR) repeat protein